MTSLEHLRELLLRRSVRTGDFLLASGRRSTYYIDARLTTMSAEGLQLVGDAALEAIRAAGWAPQAVGGLTMGADPVAYAIAMASLRQPPIIDAFSVRKTAKSHGAGRRIEGSFARGIPVVITEDVITSGSSAIQAIEAVQEEGGVVLGVVAVVDREEGGRSAIEGRGVDVVSLATTSSLGLK